MPRRSKTDKAELFSHYWRVLRGGTQLSHRDPVEEYNFDAPRKHRYDFAWVEQKIAIEIDGNAWRTKGGGSHGSDTDREKRNIGVMLGWSVFYFSPQMMNNDPQACIDMVCAKLAAATIPF